LRTIHVRNGIASVRVGATLLIDSDPDAEERETRAKAAALLDALDNEDVSQSEEPTVQSPSRSERSHDLLPGKGLNVLLIDHEDSFVHTLAGYLSRTGATVTTVRISVGGVLDASVLANAQPDLVVISPGPGAPSDFNLSDTLQLVVDQSLPVFGVCLGLQGIVEFFGGDLGVLDHPWHGRSCKVKLEGEGLFDGLPDTITVGRYHSLYARKNTMPSVLTVTAESEDGVVMAVEHKDLPIAAVQFHPESMMTLKDETGMQMIRNVVTYLVRR